MTAGQELGWPRTEVIAQYWTAPLGHLGVVTRVKWAIRGARSHPWLCRSFQASVFPSVEGGEQWSLRPWNIFGSVPKGSSQGLSLATLGWVDGQSVTRTCKVLLVCFGISLCCIKVSAAPLERAAVTQRDWGLSQDGNSFVPGENNVPVVRWLS